MLRWIRLLFSIVLLVGSKVVVERTLEVGMA